MKISQPILVLFKLKRFLKDEIMNKTFFVHITFYKTFVDEIETKTYKIVCVPSHIRNEIDKIYMTYHKEHPECVRFHSNWRGKYTK